MAIDHNSYQPLPSLQARKAVSETNVTENGGEEHVAFNLMQIILYISKYTHNFCLHIYIFIIPNAQNIVYFQASDSSNLSFLFGRSIRLCRGLAPRSKVRSYVERGCWQDTKWAWVVAVLHSSLTGSTFLLCRSIIFLWKTLMISELLPIPYFWLLLLCRRVDFGMKSIDMGTAVDPWWEVLGMTPGSVVVHIA